MKKYITSVIKSIITLFILTALCNYAYEWNHLEKVFGPKISFGQWMAIIVITQMLFPTKELFSSTTKKDDK
jgi:hypothetical protein